MSFHYKNRITIPIIDSNGKICGFTARKLNEKSRGPKYKNNAWSEIFDKTSILYGLEYICDKETSNVNVP